MDDLTIPARFRGPPMSGNGGYVAGAIAAYLTDAHSALDQGCEVTLRAPPPLDVPLRVQLNASGGVEVLDQHSNEHTLIAQAQKAPLALSVPAPPDFESALAARADSPSLIKDFNLEVGSGLGFHPICFCCGAEVAPDQGLHVYAAPVDGFDGVAAAWRPHPCFADAAGCLPGPVLWAAIDCPGQFAWLRAGVRTGLLGRMTGAVLPGVRADQDFVIVGWCLEIERIKYFAGTAIFDAMGQMCGWSRQVWIGRRE